MSKAKDCEIFLKDNGVNCCSIIGDEVEPHYDNCGCCGEFSHCYDCNGYDPEANEVVELGSVCHECICYFYNGG